MAIHCLLTFDGFPSIMQVLNFAIEVLRLQFLQTGVTKNCCQTELFFFFLNEAGFTQGDFLSRVSRQEEDKQGQSRDQDAWDEKIEAIVERPSAHHHGEGDVRVRFLTTAVKMLIPLSWNL